MGLQASSFGNRAHQGIERSTFLINASGVLVQEWRGLKVPGHVEEVLKSVKALKKAA